MKLREMLYALAQTDASRDEVLNVMTWTRDIIPLFPLRDLHEVAILSSTVHMFLAAMREWGVPEDLQEILDGDTWQGGHSVRHGNV